VENLLEVARFRTHARSAGLREVTQQGNHVRFAPTSLKDWQRVRLDRLYPRSLVKETVGALLVPRPSTAPVGGTPLRDVELLAWAREFVDAILLAAPVSVHSA
jgi:transcription-repair coupling factor (superfamily II helicase)